MITLAGADFNWVSDWFCSLCIDIVFFFLLACWRFPLWNIFVFILGQLSDYLRFGLQFLLLLTLKMSKILFWRIYPWTVLWSYLLLVTIFIDWMKPHRAARILVRSCKRHFPPQGAWKVFFSRNCCQMRRVVLMLHFARFFNRIILRRATHALRRTCLIRTIQSNDVMID